MQVVVGPGGRHAVVHLGPAEHQAEDTGVVSGAGAKGGQGGVRGVAEDGRGSGHEGSLQ